MKKFLILMAVAMMTVMGAKAQNGYADTRHEIGIGIGWMSTSQWLDAFEDVGFALAGTSFKDEKYIGPFSGEYFYRAKEWLGVGGIVALGMKTQDVYLGSSKNGDLTNLYITLMPAVKLDWLRKEKFGMYSKIGVGGTMRAEEIDYGNNSGIDYSDTSFHLNWQLSLLGMEVGSPRIRVFGELGFGEQGIALFGVRTKF